jgi:hypothetical protein
MFLAGLGTPIFIDDYRPLGQFVATPANGDVQLRGRGCVGGYRARDAK